MYFGKIIIILSSWHVSEDADKTFDQVDAGIFNLSFFTSGFNIEIKWDMENMDGTRESHNAFEMNVFVDAILLTVLRNAKSRKIVFSTFNPDICTV